MTRKYAHRLLRCLSLAGMIVAPFFPGTAAHASAVSDLNHFFHDVHTVSAKFDQVVLDEALNPLQESSGTLWIERPGKFRWDYDLPFKQLIVGDGKKIWVYDKELQQVTVRSMTGGLGNTPAILLAGKGSLTANFAIRDMGRQGKLDWVQMKPKTRDGGFDDIRIGFGDGQIRSLVLVDSFGHTTRITLTQIHENGTVDPATFRFRPPKGVDVVGQ
ncbi:MAG: outer membrane lipoprotein chaperone LolA [Acidiferrobacterales bacterium]